MKTITFNVRQTGYDDKDTDFKIMGKDSGTAPDIKIYQSGMYEGDLTLSQRGAEKLIEALCYIIDKRIDSTLKDKK